MSEQPMYQPPQVVAKELDISPATLRRWSDEFADYLSSEATSANGRSHRRYTDSDRITLMTIKELMNNGLTYEQVRQQLANHYRVPLENSVPTPQGHTMYNSTEDDFGIEYPDNEQPEQDEEKAVIVSNGNESPAIAFLTNTLTALSDTQKSILNSQAANRELLGVLIQDNFNLKEENNRLRERILEIERGVAKSRQEEEWRREALRQEMDAKLAAVQQLANEAVVVAHSTEVPDIKAVNTKPGCLGSLLGMGNTQIVTVPRRRDRAAREASLAGPSRTAPIQPASFSPRQQPPVAHPKPTLPPE